MTQSTPNSTKQLVQRIYDAYLSSRWGILTPALIAMALAAAMTATFAALMQPIIDYVFIEGRQHWIIPVACAVFACFLIRGLATYAHVLLIHMVGQGVVAQIQKDLFIRLLSMDLAFFKEKNSGTLTAHMISDVHLMRSAVADTLTAIGRNILTLIFLIGVMVWRDPILALGALILFPVATWFVVFLGKKLRQISGRTQETMGDLTGMLSQAFQGIRQVKSFSQEHAEAERVGHAVDQVRKLNLKIIRTGNMSTPINDLMVGFFVAGLIVYGGVKIAAADMTTGELMSFITAFLMAYEPMKKLAKLNNNLQVGLAAADRVFGMMDEQAQIVNKAGAKEFQAVRITLSLNDVHFTYDRDEGDVLRGITATAEPGQVIALVGASGSGKTSLLNLIPRFYDVSDGAITLNDMDVRDMTLNSLRAHIGIVSQDIVLFDSSIAANIAYGRPDADMKAIEKAAKAANAHDFIMDMPDGYDSLIGESGARLSGGQRQRLAIARAVLKDAPILLLDEATSALDSESEALVQDSLARLQKDKTSLVIAHRLSTVMHADEILVLENGYVVERGTHDQLLSLDGVYARLVNSDLRQ